MNKMSLWFSESSSEKYSGDRQCYMSDDEELGNAKVFFFAEMDESSRRSIQGRQQPCFDEWSSSRTPEVFCITKKNSYDSYFIVGCSSYAHKPKSQRNAQSVLLQVYEKSTLKEDGDALRSLFSAIENAFADGDLEFVDDLLEQFEPEKVKKIVSVGMLRSTFRVRTELKFWKYCLAKVAYLLIKDQQPASHLLRGLYNNNGQPLLAKRQAV